MPSKVYCCLVPCAAWGKLQVPRYSVQDKCLEGRWTCLRYDHSEHAQSKAWRVRFCWCCLYWIVHWRLEHVSLGNSAVHALTMFCICRAGGQTGSGRGGVQWIKSYNPCDPVSVPAGRVNSGCGPAEGAGFLGVRAVLTAPVGGRHARKMHAAILSRVIYHRSSSDGADWLFPATQTISAISPNFLFVPDVPTVVISILCVIFYSHFVFHNHSF